MAEDRKFSISEAAEITGYKPHVIRFYEKEFNLDIPRNKSNHRYFTYKEIETLKYIKQLQEKGLTNNQIRMILNSPEVIVGEDAQSREIAVSRSVTASPGDINRHLEECFVRLRDEIKGDINQLSHDVRELSEEIRAKDKDVLICENAKLKMELKKKAYEVAELKEQLRRERNKNKSFLSRLFNR